MSDHWEKAETYDGEKKADEKQRIEKQPLIQRRWFRILFGVLLPLLLTGGAVFLYLFRNPFICIFHEVTGLYCPGCGAGRAAYELLHLHVLTALGYNPLFVLALPLVAYYVLKMYLKIVTGKDRLPLFCVTVRQFLIVIALILLFGILRNIPFIPFQYLAPGGLFV